MIQIFTDGSARGNPGPGGWGAIVATDDVVTELGGREEHTTNNRMELLAVISALEFFPKIKEFIIYTDSAYVLSGATRWIYGWQKNNWKTSQKEDVLNRDLWERLIINMENKEIDWRLLKGHSGIPANERCDVIATSFADKKPMVLYSGSKDRYGVDLSIKEKFELKMKEPPKSYFYSYVSLVGGIIKIHKTWADCKSEVLGVKGAKYRKAKSSREEEIIIREFGGK